MVSRDVRPLEAVGKSLQTGKPPRPLEVNEVQNDGFNFVPEGTRTYSIHRDPRYFWPHPDTFWPERWLTADQDQRKNGTTTSEKIVHERQAFMPFSFGPTGCIGKQLAYNEMRLVVAMLVHKFDMHFADGYDSKQWEEGLEDYTVRAKGELPVVLNFRL